MSRVFSVLKGCKINNKNLNNGFTTRRLRWCHSYFFICRVDVRQKKNNYEVLWRISYKKVMYLEPGGTVNSR